MPEVYELHQISARPLKRPVPCNGVCGNFVWVGAENVVIAENVTLREAAVFDVVSGRKSNREQGTDKLPS